MSFYSYIDTALRVIHINRKNEGETERVEKLNTIFKELKGSRNFKSAIINENIKFNLQSPEVNALLIHESHHYWQSIFYPYLFYINFLEFHSLCIMRLQLSNYHEDYIKLGTLLVHPKIDHNLRYCTDKFRYSWDNKNNLQITDKGITVDQKYDLDVFCINDLIEDATTIFQFKATTPKPDADSYFRWVQDPANKGYKKLYKFLVRRFNKEYAYHFIPILVQLAFHTTEPASMFMNLVNITIYHGMSEDDYADWDYSIMKILLADHVDLVNFSVEDIVSINDMPVGFINNDFFRQVIDYAYSNTVSVHYPLSIHARKHLAWITEDDWREETLLGVENDNLKTLMERYFPFAIHFNFLDQEARDTGLLIASPDFKTVVINGNTIDYEHIIKEQLNMQDTTMSLFYRLHRETPHQCGHEDCPYYSMLLCKKWNSIPKKFENCRFPHWFPVHYRYKLLPKENAIQRVTSEEFEVYSEAFNRLFKKFSHDKFRYLFNGGLVTLDIGKDIIDGNDYEYIIEFVEKMLEEKTIPEFAESVILKFNQYGNDEREVFEIPEIRTYMTKVYEEYPTFFYFLNFDPQFQQISYLFPFYVKYTLNKLPDRSYGILMDHDSYMEFAKELSYIIATFAKKQGLEIQTELERFFKHILT